MEHVRRKLKSLKRELMEKWAKQPEMAHARPPAQGEQLALYMLALDELVHEGMLKQHLGLPVAYRLTAAALEWLSLEYPAPEVVCATDMIEFFANRQEQGLRNAIRLKDFRQEMHRELQSIYGANLTETQREFIIDDAQVLVARSGALVFPKHHKFDKDIGNGWSMEAAAAPNFPDTSKFIKAIRAGYNIEEVMNKELRQSGQQVHNYGDHIAMHGAPHARMALTSRSHDVHVDQGDRWDFSQPLDAESITRGLAEIRDVIKTPPGNDAEDPPESLLKILSYIQKADKEGKLAPEILAEVQYMASEDGFTLEDAKKSQSIISKLPEEFAKKGITQLAIHATMNLYTWLIVNGAAAAVSSGMV